MNMERTNFPHCSLVYPGVMLGTVAHAVAVARYPSLSHEQSWDGGNYCIQDSDGSRGTISFDRSTFVAAFFSEESERNPFVRGSQCHVEDYLAGLSGEIKSLAYNEAFQYLLQDWDGGSQPIVTSVFWGDSKSDYIQASENWDSVYRNGAYLIEKQLSPFDKALYLWADYFQFSRKELVLVQSIYQQKMKVGDSDLHLSHSEVNALRAMAINEDSLNECEESFSEINISL
ncbi:hypothetical protein [Thalassoglobus polymorphus]|uniref:Uncharacterized protein n=1 Tax=Thalassoglobus polymorphus TaxID=2527994 RepID=A0A517QJT9_9PLAN|nr:hypothetical protein [Thalassoglobus polymorphus]QDT31912.1 hypothetical protein Mal48_11490 [Thalassoglobus polymorphus]